MTEKNIYDNIDPEGYAKRRQKNPIEEYQYEHWHPLVLAAIMAHAKDAVVLDLGCGAGNYSFEIAKHAKHVFGLDSSQRMLEYAKKTYPGIEFIYGDATNIPLENGSIDTVFSAGLFEYVEDKKKLTQEISRVLKPDGTGIILAPNKYSMPRFLHALWCSMVGKKRVCSEPSFGQMLGMFRGAGLEVIDYRMDDGLFFLPGTLDKYIFGKRAWLFVEHCFKPFGRNPFSMNMLFIIKKR